MSVNVNTSGKNKAGQAKYLQRLSKRLNWETHKNLMHNHLKINVKKHNLRKDKDSWARRNANSIGTVWVLHHLWPQQWESAESKCFEQSVENSCSKLLHM